MAATGPKFPHVEVKLSGHDGNPFFVIGTVQRALRRGGATPEQIAEFSKQATSGDYDNVIQTCMAYVRVV